MFLAWFGKAFKLHISALWKGKLANQTVVRLDFCLHRWLARIMPTHEVHKHLWILYTASWWDLRWRIKSFTCRYKHGKFNLFNPRSVYSTSVQPLIQSCSLKIALSLSFKEHHTCGKLSFRCWDSFDGSAYTYTLKQLISKFRHTMHWHVFVTPNDEKQIIDLTCKSKCTEVYWWNVQISWISLKAM